MQLMLLIHAKNRFTVIKNCRKKMVLKNVKKKKSSDSHGLCMEMLEQVNYMFIIQEQNGNKYVLIILM